MQSCVPTVRLSVHVTAILQNNSRKFKRCYTSNFSPILNIVDFTEEKKHHENKNNKMQSWMYICMYLLMNRLSAVQLKEYQKLHKEQIIHVLGSSV